jgi:hypothetical protein
VPVVPSCECIRYNNSNHPVQNPSIVTNTRDNIFFSFHTDVLFQKTVTPQRPVVRSPSVLFFLYKSKIQGQTKLQTRCCELHHRKVPSQIQTAL